MHCFIFHFGRHIPGTNSCIVTDRYPWWMESVRANMDSLWRAGKIKVESILRAQCRLSIRSERSGSPSSSGEEDDLLKKQDIVCRQKGQKSRRNHRNLCCTSLWVWVYTVRRDWVRIYVIIPWASTLCFARSAKPSSLRITACWKRGLTCCGQSRPPVRWQPCTQRNNKRQSLNKALYHTYCGATTGATSICYKVNWTKNMNSYGVSKVHTLSPWLISNLIISPMCERPYLLKTLTSVSRSRPLFDLYDNTPKKIQINYAIQKSNCSASTLLADVSRLPRYSYEGHT